MNLYFILREIDNYTLPKDEIRNMGRDVAKITIEVSRSLNTDIFYVLDFNGVIPNVLFDKIDQLK